MWQKEDMVAALCDLSVDAVQNFVPALLSNLHVEMLVHGNATEKSAIRMMEVIESHVVGTFKPRPLTSAQWMRQREVNLLESTHSVYTTTTEVHKSSCIETYYQCGMQETRKNVLLELFWQVISEPCFNILRTKEQLGYIVWSGLRRACGVQGLRVIVQSDRHPDYLDERIEAFLASMEDYIEKMSEETFESNKTALADKTLEKPKKLSARTAKFWGEIAGRQYNFDRDNIEVKELRYAQ